MRKLRKYLPNIFVCIVLVFSLLGAESLAFVKYVLLDENTYVQMVDSNKVDEKVYGEIKKYFDDNYDNTGIKSDVYMNSLGADAVRDVIINKISAACSYIDGSADKYEDPQFDFTRLERELEEYFRKFADENNVEMNDAFKAQLENTAETAKEEINSCSDVFLLEELHRTGVLSKARKAYKFFPAALFGCIILSGLMLITLILMNRKNIADFLYWLSCAGVASSAVTLIPCVWLKASRYFDRLVIRTSYIYHSVTGLCYQLLDAVIRIQCAILLVSAVIMVIYVAVVKIKCRKLS